MRRGNAVCLGLLVFFFALANFRIVRTYSIYSQTDDESYHIACGMEWLSRGTYTYELQHPPLARIAVALGPYLLGIRSFGLDHPAREGNAILNADNQYFRNLTAARVGNLFFLLIACAGLAAWGWSQYGAVTAVCSVGLFTMLPPMLGHAGLATTDLACTAGVIAAVLAFLYWLDQPSLGRLLLFAVAYGFAILTKFSGPIFVTLGAAPALIELSVRRRLRLPWKGVWFGFLALVVCSFVVWTGYRFSLNALSAERAGASKYLPHAITDTRLPLTEAVAGVYDVFNHNHLGHDSFLLGRYSPNGFRLFFPVALAVKTPLAFLLLAIVGGYMIVRRPRTAGETACATFLPVVLAGEIFLMGLFASIDIGIRHILPIYAPLALCAGYAVANLKRPLAILGIALAVITCVESISAKDDYLPWFNVLGGSHPERILADSDLDWGQDLHRLTDRLHSRGVQDLSLAYFGTADLTKAGLPPNHPLEPFKETRGWIAISARYLTLEHARDRSYEWLLHYQPVERIGKSIFLYYLPPC